jgi:hypothetical protein
MGSTVHPPFVRVRDSAWRVGEPCSVVPTTTHVSGEGQSIAVNAT